MEIKWESIAMEYARCIRYGFFVSKMLIEHCLQMGVSVLLPGASSIPGMRIPKAPVSSMPQSRNGEEEFNCNRHWIIM